MPDFQVGVTARVEVEILVTVAAKNEEAALGKVQEAADAGAFSLNWTLPAPTLKKYDVECEESDNTASVEDATEV